MPRHAVYAAAAALVLVAGCGKPGREIYQLSGTVTYGGQPLKAGFIRFDPDFSKGHDGPQGSAQVKDGRYDTRSPGAQGVAGGPYVVYIQGYDGVPGPELPFGKPIFPEFSVKVDLPKDSGVQDFDVPKR